MRPSVWSTRRTTAGRVRIVTGGPYGGTVSITSASANLLVSRREQIAQRHLDRLGHHECVGDDAESGLHRLIFARHEPDLGLCDRQPLGRPDGVDAVGVDDRRIVADPHLDFSAGFGFQHRFRHREVDVGSQRAAVVGGGGLSAAGRPTLCRSSSGRCLRWRSVPSEVLVASAAEPRVGRICCTTLLALVLSHRLPQVLGPSRGDLDYSSHATAQFAACWVTPSRRLPLIRPILVDNSIHLSQSRSIGRLNGSMAADSASASECRFASSVSWISCRCS